MTTLINGTDVQKMISHWLNTPVNGYLGASYGQDTFSLLQQPQNNGSADQYLAKLKTDIPLLGILPNGTVNLYAVSTQPDKLNIVLDIAGANFTIG